MQKELIKHWNSYYSSRKDFGLITAQMLTQILNYTDSSLSKLCLDIGCGTGQLTRELYHRGYRCHGVDVSNKAIDLARSYTTNSSQLTYQQLDFETADPIDLPIQEYSLITCKLVYAFIKDKPAFLSKISQLLAPSGTFALITPINKGGESKKIAVDYNQTLIELEMHFKVVKTIESPNMVAFICQRF